MKIKDTKLIIKALKKEHLHNIFRYSAGYDIDIFYKIKNCSLKDKNDLFQMCQVFNISIIHYEKDSSILESVHTESMMKLLNLFHSITQV